MLSSHCSLRFSRNAPTTGSFLIYFSIYDGAWSVASPIPATTGGNSPRVTADAEDVYAIRHSNNSIYYAEYNGVWSDNSPSNYDIYFTCIPSSQTGITEDADGFPDRSVISYNFPNPFNSTNDLM